MLPRNHPDRIQIAFDDHRLVAIAGLLLPATLAHHLGLSQLVQQRPNPGNAPGRANTGDKVMLLVAPALPSGDCIVDADAVAARQRRGHQRQHLVSRVRPPRRIPEVEVTVNQFTQAHVLGQSGRKEQPGIVDQAVVVEGLFGCGRGPQVVASVGCSLFPVGFLSRKPLSQKHRITFLPLHHAATIIPSVDWG